MNKIIFLDFDGVINGCGLFVGLCTKIIPQKIFRFVERKILHTELYGVHKSKVKRLAKICRVTGAKIVLTSSWRDIVYDHYIGRGDDKFDDAKKLASLFRKYNIEVLGVTPHMDFRGEEICTWIKSYKEKIQSFIILDDEYTHLPKMNVFTVYTTTNTPEKRIQGKWYCMDGLRNKHVDEAIRKLNGYIYENTCANFMIELSVNDKLIESMRELYL